jgi:hypothetical protein
MYPPINPPKITNSDLSIPAPRIEGRRFDSTYYAMYEDANGEVYERFVGVYAGEHGGAHDISSVAAWLTVKANVNGAFAKASVTKMWFID